MWNTDLFPLTMNTFSAFSEDIIHLMNCSSETKLILIKYTYQTLIHTVNTTFFNILVTEEILIDVDETFLDTGVCVLLFVTHL